jgi:hypothetical protein
MTAAGRSRPSAAAAALAMLLLLAACSVLPAGAARHNDVDTLAQARQAAEPSWLPGDWYLAQPAGHRAVFNRLAGPLVARVPLGTAAVVGRLLTFGLFAAALLSLLRALGLGPGWGVPVAVAFVPLQSAIAGEWMVGGLETKPFAYAASLSAVAALLAGRQAVGWLLLGVAAALHVLVGFYASLCAAAMLLGARGTWRERVPPPRAAALFLLASAPGWLAVLRELATPAGALAQEAAAVYVRLRNPHHLLCSSWLEQGSGAAKLAAVGAMASIAALAALRHPDERCRALARFALASAGLFALGLAWEAWGADSLLRLYWYRLPSVVLPLLTLLLAAERLQAAARRRALEPNLRAALTLAALLTACGAAWSLGRQAETLGQPARAFHLQAAGQRSLQVQLWIRRNTPRGAVFLTGPGFEELYVLAERARFVSYKHVPHTTGAIVEWYRRILRLSGGMAPSSAGLRAPMAEIEARFRRLPATELLAIAQDYGLTHALLDAEADPFRRDAAAAASVRELYRNAMWTVYELGPSGSALRQIPGTPPARD